MDATRIAIASLSSSIFLARLSVAAPLEGQWGLETGLSLTQTLSTKLSDRISTKAGYEFMVNTITAGGQEHPAVAMSADGGFVVTWASRDQDGSGSGVYAQRFDRAGRPEGYEFPVNTLPIGDEERPSVAMDGVGNFVVTWMRTE